MQNLLKLTLVFILAVAAIPEPAAAQDDAGDEQTQPPPDAPPAGEAETPQEPERPVPETFDPLLEEFLALAGELRQHGFGDPERYATITDLRSRISQFNDERTPGEMSMAAELQLILWGGEYGEPLENALARLGEVNPQHPGLRVMWADLLLQQGEVGRAGEVIEETAGLDLEQYPLAAVIRAEALIAQNRFADAEAALDAIPTRAVQSSSVLDRAYRLRQQIDRFEDAWPEEQATLDAEAQADDLPRVVLSTDKGDIIIELFENEAPNTVANFISLSEKDFYDGVTFHRVVPGFVVQGGDPRTRPAEEGADPDSPAADLPETGGPGYRIRDEIPEEGYRRHWAGYVSMAHAGADTGGSQFFITLSPAESLDGVHTVFGRVIEGMDVVRTIEQGDRITSIEVIRKRDHEYVPETIPDETAPPAPPEDEAPPPPIGEGDGGGAGEGGGQGDGGS